MKKLALSLLSLSLSLSFLRVAHADGPRKYKAPHARMESKKVTGHRMARDKGGLDHASRYKVQGEVDASRGVASEAPGHKKFSKSRGLSSESAPHGKKAKKEKKGKGHHRGHKARH